MESTNCNISAYNYKPFTSEVNFDFLDSTQPISVYFLQASLGFLNSLDKISLPIPDSERSILSVNGYHTGVGFVARKGNDTYAFVLDLIATNGMLNAILPTVQNGTLTWLNQIEITYNDIDINYWDNSTYICDITYQNLIDLKKDILYNFVPSHSLYTLFRVANSSNVQDLLNPVMTSNTCDDFSFYVFDTLQQKYGAKISYQTYPKINIAAFITNTAPKKLNITQDKEKIINFYSNIITVLKKLYGDYENLLKYYNKNHRVGFNTIRDMYTIILNQLNLTSVIHYCTDETGQPSYYEVSLVKPKIVGVFINNTTLKNNINRLCIFREGYPNGDSSNNNNLIGIIVLSVLGVVLILALLYLFFIRNRSNKNIQNFM